MQDKRAKRFVVLYHEVASAFQRTQRHHFDWMFEQDGELLQTWETSPLESMEEPVTLPALRLADHRVRYLDYEGPISGDRGVVTRVLAGTYHPSDGKDEPMSCHEQVVLTLRWQIAQSVRTAELAIYRNSVADSSRLEDNWDGWFLRFSPWR